MLEERIQLGVGFLSWRMALAVRHRHAVRMTKHLVDRDGVIQGDPTRRWVFRASGNEEWPRSNERVKFVQIAAGLHHLLIGAGPGIRARWNSGFRPRPVRIEPEIPRLPVVHVRPRFVENDAGITYRNTGELIPQRPGEQRPLPAVRVPNDADALRIHLGPVGQGLPTVGRYVGVE